MPTSFGAGRLGCVLLFLFMTSGAGRTDQRIVGKSFVILLRQAREQRRSQTDQGSFLENRNTSVPRLIDKQDRI